MEENKSSSLSLGRLLSWERISDRLGICLSLACLVHCLLLPMALLFFPTLSLFTAAINQQLHFWLMLPIFLVSLFSFRTGLWKRTKTPMALKMLPLVALLMLMFGLLSHEHHDEGQLLSHFLEGHFNAEAILTSVGGVLLIFCHWKNFRMRTTCDHPHHQH